MICSNCSQPSVLSLSEDPLQLELYFLCQQRGRLWSVESGKTLAWPSIARLSVANSSTNQERPSLIGKRSVSQSAASICRYWLEVVIVPRPGCGRGQARPPAATEQFGNASNWVYNKLPKCQSLLRVQWKLNFLLQISCYCDECWNVAWNQQ